MKLKNFIEKNGAVQKIITVNGNSYEVPYNQNLSNYEKAGALNDPDNPLSFLTSTKFTGKYHGEDPIFEVTYKLPFNSVTDVGWDGWMILEATEDQHIGESYMKFFTKDSIKVEGDWVIYRFNATPSCTLRNDNCDDEEYGYNVYESEESQCITKVLNEQLMKDSYNINITDGDWEELKESFNSHSCAPAILYDAIIGNISEDGLEELNKFLAKSSKSLESEHLMGVESLDAIKSDFIEMFDNDYLTVKDTFGERFIFIVIHED